MQGVDGRVLVHGVEGRAQTQRGDGSCAAFVALDLLVMLQAGLVVVCVLLYIHHPSVKRRSIPDLWHGAQEQAICLAEIRRGLCRGHVGWTCYPLGASVHCLHLRTHLPHPCMCVLQVTPLMSLHWQVSMKPAQQCQMSVWDG